MARRRHAAAGAARLGPCTGALIVAALAGAVTARPESALGQLLAEDPSRHLRVEFRGWIQPRYEYLRSRGGPDQSSFFLRRARLDVRGSVFTDRLTFRIQPEFAREAHLRDGYVNYEVAPLLSVQLGQFPVPFQFRVSPRRQQFAESGVASGSFSHPTTRDVGVLLHGETVNRRFSWDAGLFGGAGMNARRAPGVGHLGSARASFAVVGFLPRKASDEDREGRTLALGLGLQGARENELMDWSLGRSADAVERGDWVTGVVDAQLLYRGITSFASAFLRSVSSADRQVPSYLGWGIEASLGYALIEEHLELFARWGRATPDHDEPSARERGWDAGASWYIRGHDWKVRAEYGQHTGELEGGRAKEVRRTWIVDFQVLF